jgi:hypothetical protein
MHELYLLFVKCSFTWLAECYPPTSVRRRPLWPSRVSVTNAAMSLAVSTAPYLASPSPRTWTTSSNGELSSRVPRRRGCTWKYLLFLPLQTLQTLNSKYMLLTTHPVVCMLYSHVKSVCAASIYRLRQHWVTVCTLSGALPNWPNWRAVTVLMPIPNEWPERPKDRKYYTLMATSIHRACLAIYGRKLSHHIRINTWM